MPLFTLSTSKKNACTLFDIRLENDFIVFRGNDHEASGQLLKGTVVLCLSAPLKVETINLKLTGTIHYGWTDPRVTATGINHHRIDKTVNFYEHRWRPFAGVGASNHIPTGDTHHSRGTTLGPGNYEWPFQVMLPGNTTESVEGLREASITYRLKASVVRGKFASDLSAYKRLRIIRTLESSALEFLHAMSVENIWPNKIDYSILIPQKAVVFGTCIPLETRFTPLLKGLELGDMTVKLVEVHEIVLHSTRSSGASSVKEYRKEREIETWRLPITREEHWQDMINDSGQEGWVLNTSLNLPKKLSKCLQDVNTKGIKVRHKLKLVVALKNPDGHISELRATLPVTIFISPNMPLDEDGNLVRQVPVGTPSLQVAAIAPPGYGEHVLDQLYEDMDPTGLQTPAGGLSAVNSPIYGRSRASSVENLNALYHGASSPVNGVPFSANQLTARLQTQLNQHNRNQSWPTMRPAESARHMPSYASELDTEDARTDEQSAPPSLPLTRHNSDDDESALQHLDYAELEELSKVPSYQTAVKTPVRPLAYNVLPDYETATSVPSTPQPGSPERSPPLRATELTRSDNSFLGSIAEVPQESSTQDDDMNPQSRPGTRRTSPIRWRQLSVGLYPHHSLHGEGDEHRRLHLLRAQRGLA
ncbi:Putative protein of unknown function [Podospora comata]|uniref:Arrestin C-terminal-like domain-containing protein n=1 Tax=Podospora comata TaxID=48703 RepID=A0ABY6SBV3_PODCO|nr:Putative protein of unknown function [Podospora comata]